MAGPIRDKTQIPPQRVILDSGAVIAWPRGDVRARTFKQVGPSDKLSGHGVLSPARSHHRPQSFKPPHGFRPEEHFPTVRALVSLEVWHRDMLSLNACHVLAAHRPNTFAPTSWTAARQSPLAGALAVTLLPCSR